MNTLSPSGRSLGVLKPKACQLISARVKSRPGSQTPLPQEGPARSVPSFPSSTSHQAHRCGQKFLQSARIVDPVIAPRASGLIPAASAGAFGPPHFRPYPQPRADRCHDNAVRPKLRPRALASACLEQPSKRNRDSRKILLLADRSRSRRDVTTRASPNYSDGDKRACTRATPVTLQSKASLNHPDQLARRARPPRRETPRHCSRALRGICLGNWADRATWRCHKHPMPGS